MLNIYRFFAYLKVYFSHREDVFLIPPTTITFLPQKTTCHRFPFGTLPRVGAVVGCCVFYRLLVAAYPGARLLGRSRYFQSHRQGAVQRSVGGVFFGVF